MASSSVARDPHVWGMILDMDLDLLHVCQMII